MWWIIAVSGGCLLIALGLLIYLAIKKEYLQYSKKKRKRVGKGILIASLVIFIGFVVISVLQHLSIAKGEEMSLKEMDQYVNESDTKNKAATESLSQSQSDIENVYKSVTDNLVNGRAVELFLEKAAFDFLGAHLQLKSFLETNKVSDLIVNYDNALSETSKIDGCIDDLSNLELSTLWTYAEKYKDSVKEKLDVKKENEVKKGLDELNGIQQKTLEDDEKKLSTFVTSIIVTLGKWKTSLETLRRSLKNQVAKAETSSILFWMVVALVYIPNLLGCIVLICFGILFIITIIQLRKKYKTFNHFVKVCVAAALGALVCLYLISGEVYLYLQQSDETCIPKTVNYDMFNYDVPQFIDSVPPKNVENIMMNCKSPQNSLFADIVSIDNIELQSYKKKVINKIAVYKTFWNQINLKTVSNMMDGLTANSNYLKNVTGTCMAASKKTEFKTEIDNFANALTKFNDEGKRFLKAIKSPEEIEVVRKFVQNINAGETKLNDLRSSINTHAKAHDHQCLPIKQISEKAANHQCVQHAKITDSAKTIPIFVMASSICWSNILYILILAIFFYRRKKLAGNNEETAILNEDDLDFDMRSNLLAILRVLKSLDIPAVAKNWRVSFRKFLPDGATFEACMNNLSRSRNSGVFCYDQNRVVLQNRVKDYIHASLVEFPNKRRYICTQGPMLRNPDKKKNETIDAFWTMCYQQGAKFIVMLCNDREDEKDKCDIYYPENLQKSVMEFDNMKVVFKSISPKLEGVNWRVLEVSEKNSKNKPLLVNHFQVQWWPDHDVPNDPQQLLKLLDDLHKLNKDPDPIVVHCSAGIGRTGTFVLIDYVLEQIKVSNNVIIAECFKYVRSLRYGAIQTEMQYIFIYFAILRYCVMKGVAKEEDVSRFKDGQKVANKAYEDYKVAEKPADDKADNEEIAKWVEEHEKRKAAKKKAAKEVAKEKPAKEATKEKPAKEAAKKK